MASKVQKPCKICGKMFTPCADCENDKTMFRWKRVACSPECAKEYFIRIKVSRQHIIKQIESQPIEKENIETNDAASDCDVKIIRTKKSKKNFRNKEREQID